ncbi:MULTISPECIES: phage tail fiber domain-containing protein [Burkholderia]|uniref:phage tail fiber domain-containing protein n=1 Tax=Burkholderia TaxID=32008 RepID=UPI00075D0BBE|nr:MULTISPECIES: phage tail fiber protein [Burkholderia]AOJ69170.1 hypothetical protein WS78_10685 [Burkholderia savannae]KVG39809.1 hypothetical protein WS77_19235 [Burkholderia sp. MSMB0265]KVG85780.1 hypothetical protein WS81_31440 [Burkholderia sp. MSMB2040]KVG92205.1 hypothetical protein WS82_12210 [Burkholderia sp. MSMB2041]KVG95716.1 hypothetical protein WS83_04025 [Burkholderia sp. MSMB2042]
MAADYLVPWLDASGQGGLRNSMLVASGDGSTKTFSFNFAGGYISKDHVKAYTFDPITGRTTPLVITSGMWTGPSQITLGAPVALGQYIVIYRDTPRGTPLVSFKNGSVLNEPNLDEMAEQGVFVAAEMADRFDLLNDGSSKAIIDSATALNTANAATATAKHADGNAAFAVDQSNAARGDATFAVNTAGAAKAVADGIDGKAQQALDNSKSAVNTANIAQSVANGIDAKAQSALDNSKSAVNSASSADTAAANAVSTANGIDAKATQAQSDAAAAVATANAAVQKSGDKMSGALYVPQVILNFGLEGDGSAPGIYNDPRKRNIVFRSGPPGAYKYSYFGEDGALVLSARPGWGATPWDTDNFDPNGKLTKGEDVGWRLRLTASNWQADLGLRSGYNDNTWAYIRARQGGGVEIINNAYSAVTWAVDDWGNMFSRGSHRMTPDGNWWFENRGWSNDVLNDLYNRSAPRECQFNSGAVEFGPLTAGATLQAPNPYVMIGLRTASSDYMRMGEQFIRCVTIRTY